MFIVVPNSLSAAINAKLDSAFILTPDAEKDRDELYRQLVAFYNENGYLPEFTLTKKDSADNQGGE